MTGATGPQLREEDAARASFYALIGRLFFHAPDAALLTQIARVATHADTTSAFGAARAALGAACNSADAEALAGQHLNLFIGIGKAQVTPYTSSYVTQTSAERHLVALRQALAALGLSRRVASTDAEDHVAALCDVMRHLITRQVSEAVQKEFFHKFIYLGAVSLCDKVCAVEPDGFYAAVARFALAFMEIEREAFEMVS